MAHLRPPPSKGRLQQRLKKLVTREIAQIKHLRNPAGHDWLVRHFERQNGRCAYCGVPMLKSPHRGQADRRATLDHVVPLSRRGDDSEENTVAACEACNKAKGIMNRQSFLITPFCIARKAQAAKVRERKPLIVLRKPRRS